MRFVFVLCLVSSSVFCLDEPDHNTAASSAVYIVTLKDPPSVHSSGRESSGSSHVLTSTSSQTYKPLYVEKSHLLFLSSSFNLLSSLAKILARFSLFPLEILRNRCFGFGLFSI